MFGKGDGGHVFGVDEGAHCGAGGGDPEGEAQAQDPPVDEAAFGCIR